MPKTVLILGAGPFQRPAIQSARKMGLRTVVVDGNPSAIGFAEADHAYPVDVKNVTECLKIAEKYKIDGVLTVAAEAAVSTVAEIAQAMGLPGVTPQAALNATDKSRMRACFEKAGVPSPLSRKAWSQAEARAHAESIGLPVVIKPADSAGSRGVSLLEDIGQLEQAYAGALNHSPQKLVLVEEFMPGVEISVEAFVHRGKVHILALSDKIRTRPPHLLDATVIFPSTQPRPIQLAAREVAKQAIYACDLDTATIHMEQIVTPGGPKVVELAARGAGFHVFTELLPWATGVDTVAELIRMSLGEEPQLEVTQNRACVLHFPELKPGLVRAIQGVDKARQLPGIFDLELYIKPGDRIRPLTSGADRPGHIIAFGPTRDEAISIAKTAENTLEISYSEDQIS